jgi:hypothetical protein
MEIFSDNWNIRAGDVFLENRASKFLNFSKKKGISTSFDFEQMEIKLMYSHQQP